MTRIILVRHGETEWNRVERFRGRADVPLNEKGRRQAQAAGSRVARLWRPDVIYASPLSRAMDTARAIAAHFELDVQAHPGLIDIDYGDWQGLAPDEAAKKWPVEIDHWYNHPEKALIPNGESLDDLRRRARKMLDALVRQHPDQTIVLIGHTVINRVILLSVMGLGSERFWRLRQDTCAINVFDAIDDDFIIVSLNNTSHLDDIR